ncbi:MAG: hypothetical protein JKY50_03710 [Oleispira sp.]|nr:hypothetical protein [Oleispira sp.]
MKKGLKITDQVFLNKDNICSWFKNDNSMQIITSASRGENTFDIYTDGSNIPKEHNQSFMLEINEYKRIEREINEYMGV